MGADKGEKSSSHLSEARVMVVSVGNQIDVRFTAEEGGGMCLPGRLEGRYRGWKSPNHAHGEVLGDG